MTYTFIVWDKCRHSETITAENEDLAWEQIHMLYPDAEYIESY